MKKIATMLSVLCALGLSAAQLPISPEGQKEADLYFSFLRASLESSNTEEFCPAYADMLKQDPQNKYLRRQLLLCALGQKDMQTAEQYADFIEQGENDGEDLAVYAFYLLRKGNVAGAQQYYEEALNAAPDDNRILYQYLLLLSVVDVDQAAQKLQERKEQFPGQAALLDYETGNLYQNRRLWKQALSYYQAAKKEKPQYPEPYLASAEIYEKTNQVFLMLHELEEVEKLGYENATVYAKMGSVYLLVKDDARAKTYFQKAKALDKANVTAGYFLALYAEREGDLARAAQYLRETSDYATDAGKWLQVSFYQQQMGDNQGALETLQEAYKRFDKNVEIGYFYALLLQDNGKYKQAARVLKGVLDTNSAYENARLAYAFSLESLGKYKEMEEQVRLLIEQNPKNAAAYNLLGFSLAERNTRLDEALELITKAVSINPKDAAFQDSLAWVYYRQGEVDRAQQLLEALPASFVEKNAEVGYHLGAVYAAQSEVQKALPYLQQAAKENKDAEKLLKKLMR
ncbi:MAG: tetratricopeptide repeat protein [Elusimicrobiaceae bacterium]|nr:tetratricopeptide repeat protein [Elusimicrobiaceae bacterium]